MHALTYNCPNTDSQQKKLNTSKQRNVVLQSTAHNKCNHKTASNDRFAIISTEAKEK